jgi:hypothetical protein
VQKHDKVKNKIGQRADLGKFFCKELLVSNALTIMGKCNARN